MKHNFKKRLLSVLLCVSMLVPMLTQYVPAFKVGATDPIAEATRETLAANVGNQAIFDWWYEFDVATDEDSKPGEVTSIYYDDLGENIHGTRELVVKLGGYYYDAETGDHWYKVEARDGEALPDVLDANPWVLYCNDADKETGYAPYLAIYGKDDVIRFVYSEIVETEYDDDGNLVKETSFYNSYVIAGPAALKDAEIKVSPSTSDYSVSSLAHTVADTGVTHNRAFDVSITKANDEPWTASDGIVSVRYEVLQFGSDTFTETIDFGGAFLYSDGTMISAAVSDRYGEVSDVVYVNSGLSTLVFEYMNASFEAVNLYGFFKNNTVTLYDNTFASKSFKAADLPESFRVACSLTYNGAEYYWIESNALFGSPYFLAEADQVALSFFEGDGYVTVTDKNGDPVDSITVSKYQKTQVEAYTSISLATADVDYQWQIEYEEGKWVDIYGEDEKTINISFGMVASLLEDDDTVNIRCRTRAASLVAYSLLIPVTADMYATNEPEVVVSDSFVTSSGETVTVSVAGSIPEDASVSLGETDSTGVDVAEGETVVASLDISIKNADGSEWQPESGENVTVTLEASKLGLANGDRFVVYHLHDGEVKILGTYVVENDTVSFDVDGFSKFVFALAADNLETPDFSSEVGKHAVLTRAEEYISVLVLDEEPTADNIYDTLVFDVSEFPEDTVFSIEAYKVINEYFDITDKETGEFLEKGVTQWLWYQVHVVSGTMPEGFENDYWIFQNYLTEADAVEVDTLTLFDAPEEPEEPEEDVYITVDGNPVTEITIDQSSTVAVVAKSTLPSAAINYVWQIMIPGTDMWVDISGETSPEIDVYYGKVASMLDSNGVAYIRCVSTVGTSSITSESIAVTVVQTLALRARSSSYGLMADTESDTNTAKKFTITIHYVYGNDTSKIVDDPTVIELGENDSYDDIVTFPVKSGYLAYIQPLDGTLNTSTPATGLPINVSNPTADTTLFVYYYPTYVKYKIEYYKQKWDNDEYELVQTLEATGLAESPAIMPGQDGYNGETLTEDFAGFYELKYNIPDVAAAGNTVIQVYYNRYYYLMTFDLNGANAYGVQPVYARYGTPIEIGTPVNPGFAFVGWDDVSSGNGDGIQDSLSSTMPVGGKKYKAIWKEADLAKVTVVYWGENANDTEYSYYGSSDIYVKPGTELTYTGAGNTLICGIEVHTHGDGCTYKCGLEEHDHSLADNCYSLTCQTPVHDVHTNSCYKDTIHNHGTACYSGVGSEFSQGITEHYVKGTESNGSIGESYFYYGLGERATGNKYIYIDGTWYIYSGDTAIGGTAVTICGKTEHTAHTDACLQCGGLHTHTIEDNCYTLSCSKTLHNHVDACYDCIQHTHSDACYLSVTPKLSDSNLWVLNTEKTKSVTVAADGTTILGVYYDRTKFTVTFNSDGGKINYATIEKKWGASIRSEFIAASTAAKTYMWSRDDDNASNGPWTSFLAVMPQENRDYYGYVSSSNNVYNATYYGLKLGGTPGNKDDYEVLFPIEFKYGAGLNITEEEFEDIEGYTINKSLSSKLEEDYDDSAFYYDRNSYVLEFISGTTSVGKESVLYEAPLSTYAAYDKYKNPPFPSDLYEKGSRVFAGWYLDPDCSGDEFDLTTHKMPADNLVLYAKWEPVVYTVNVWTLRNADGTYVGKTDDPTVPLRNQTNVPHGSKIQGMTIPEAPELVNGRYTFDGWFYIDEITGDDTPWSFEMQVKQDLDIYAKWISNEIIKYEVSYWHVDENGNKIEEIADKETGSNLAGLTETFYAKGGNELKEGYREGYFPTTTSTSITLDINQETMYVEFHYIQHDPVPYTVKYLLNNSDGTTTELFPSVTYNDNKKAVVVENAKMKSGYKVDEPQKSLIVDIAEGATNEIIFYYEVDANASFYDVTHKIKKYNSNEWEEYRFNQYNAQVNGNASSNPLTIPGYTYMETASDGSQSVTKGTVTAEGLHLVFYYEEDEITIDYKPVNSNDVVDNTSSGTISATTETTGALNGTIDGSTATAKPGYEFTGWYSDADCTQKVSSDAKFVPERNSDGLYESATYYAKFEETRVTIIYVVDGGVGGTVSPGAEALGAATGTAKGSTATNDPGYRFIGWYKDAACTIPAATVTGTKLTPAKEGSLNVSATYYAKFEETNTTINYKIVDPDGNVYDANQACGALSSFGETVLTATGAAIGSTATNNPGYSFVGWYDNASCTGTPISTNANFVPTKDANALWEDGTTYYAKFVEDEVVISYKVVGPDGCGTVALNDNSATGTSVSETIGEATGDAQGATANKNPGYEFKGWFTNEACNGDPVSTAISYDPQKVDGLNVSATYYAKFEEIKVTINYVVDGVGGTVTPGSEELGAATGTASGSTAAAKDGYTFAGWYDKNGQKLSSVAEFVPERNSDGLYESATYYAKFTENSATIKYKIVDPDGNVYDANQACGALSSFAETVLVVTGKANGSKATPNAPTFKFVGWYSDADCKNLLSKDPDYQPTKDANALWVNGTTFYAKFEYNLTSLTIEKLTGYINGDAFVNKSYDDIDQNQTFIFTVSGKDAKGNDMSIDVTVHVSDGSGSTTIDGITVGQSYTITEKTDWSWRYECAGWSHNNGGNGTGNVAVITAGLDGVVTFKDVRTDEQWLDGDSWCDNRFGPSAAN